MEQLAAATRYPIQITYRAVGSGTGQTEFFHGYNVSGTKAVAPTLNLGLVDFASGDVPISSEAYEELQAQNLTIAHFPVLLGGVSFFHTLPDDAPAGEPIRLNLTPCVLAQLFTRQITDWLDDEIVKLNPDLSSQLNGTTSFPVNIVHRDGGSSSTFAITHYFRENCPDIWGNESFPNTGTTVEWPADTMECEGSGGVTNCLIETPGSLGYVDSSHGRNAAVSGLREVAIPSTDEPNLYLTSGESAEKGGILSAAAGSFPEKVTDDFGKVSLLNRPGKYTWPLVLPTYIYVRQDLRTLFPSPQEQALLQHWLRAMYNDDYIQVCVDDFHFIRPSLAVQEWALKSIDEDIIVDSDATPWTFENETTAITGAGLYVSSVKRQSWSMVHRDDLEENIRDNTERLAVLEQGLGGTSLQSQLESIQSKIDDVQRRCLVLSSIALIVGILAGCAAVLAYQYSRPTTRAMSGEWVPAKPSTSADPTEAPGQGPGSIADSDADRVL
jgi:ABC-type phosphate transport system substrate-binding protein